MKYNPEVNHYVKWKENVEGWVYFKDSNYITIEMSVRPKPLEDYKNSSIHRNERVLVLCYKNQWKELTYIKSRKSVNDES
jgi:hypothetical protein